MAKATRRCSSCKTDISARGNKSVRCAPCQAAFRCRREQVDPDRKVCADADGTCSSSRLKRGRCSRHYYTARRDNGLVIPQQTRPCTTCGVMFTPVRSDAVCCSTLCNWRRQDACARVDHPERRCETCGIAFKPRRYDARYCQIDCIADPAVRATARWCSRNKAKVSAGRHRRNAMLTGNPDSVGISERDWKRLVNRHGGRCAYCQAKPVVITVDHVIPINRGGRHSIGNVLPACKSCNSAKRDVLLAEFRRRMRRDAEKREQVAQQQAAVMAQPAGGPHVAAGTSRYEQLSLELCS